jgi:hypothetical protein
MGINIKKDFREIGCKGVDWFRAGQRRLQWLALVNRAIILRVP